MLKKIMESALFKYLKSWYTFILMTLISLIIYLSPRELKESSTSLKDIPKETGDLFTGEKDKFVEYGKDKIEKGKKFVNKQTIFIKENVKKGREQVKNATWFAWLKQLPKWVVGYYLGIAKAVLGETVSKKIIKLYDQGITKANEWKEKMEKRLKKKNKKGSETELEENVKME